MSENPPKQEVLEGELVQPNPVGPPTIPIDPEKLSYMVQYGATCAECASEFKCSEDTIVRFVIRTFGMNYAEFSKHYRGQVLIRLKEAQIKTALGHTEERTVLKRRKIKRKGIDANGRPYEEITDEWVPYTVKHTMAPNAFMQIWLGKNLLGQIDHERAAPPESANSLPYDKPTIVVNVTSPKPDMESIKKEWTDQENGED